MKPAHQGVPVAALPELDAGFPSLAAILAQSLSPTPPAPVGVASGGPPRQDRNTSLDGWFLERIFGRH